MNEPLCERIYEEGHWRVVHSYDTSLEGWLCIVHAEKITKLSSMTPEDAAILGTLIRKVSIALERVTGAVKTYSIMFAESPKHPEVHFHIVPRMSDLPEDRVGVKVFGYLGASEVQVVPLERRNELAVQIRDILLSIP
jgi:diadenosine tetraphosphate (Ap4A) HIT family hydrolase